MRTFLPNTATSLRLLSTLLSLCVLFVAPQVNSRSIELIEKTELSQVQIQNSGDYLIITGHFVLPKISETSLAIIGLPNNWNLDTCRGTTPSNVLRTNLKHVWQPNSVTGYFCFEAPEPPPGQLSPLPDHLKFSLTGRDNVLITEQTFPVRIAAPQVQLAVALHWKTSEQKKTTLELIPIGSGWLTINKAALVIEIAPQATSTIGVLPTDIKHQIVTSGMFFNRTPVDLHQLSTFNGELQIQKISLSGRPLLILGERNIHYRSNARHELIFEQSEEILTIDINSPHAPRLTADLTSECDGELKHTQVSLPAELPLPHRPCNFTIQLVAPLDDIPTPAKLWVPNSAKDNDHLKVIAGGIVTLSAILLWLINIRRQSVRRSSDIANGDQLLSLSQQSAFRVSGQVICSHTSSHLPSKIFADSANASYELLTNEKGQFYLKSTKNINSLMISCHGYRSLTLMPPFRSRMTIKLESPRALLIEKLQSLGKKLGVPSSFSSPKTLILEYLRHEATQKSQIKILSRSEQALYSEKIGRAERIKECCESLDP